VALAVWTVVLGLIATVAVGLRLLIPPTGATGTCAGAWIGLAAAVLVTLSGWLSINDERPARGVSVAP
jgi:hypothetical protein